MSSTSRGISARTRTNRNSHTPGKTKGGHCVRSPVASFACNVNPYKGQGLKAGQRNGYERWWDSKYALNGFKKSVTE